MSDGMKRTAAEQRAEIQKALEGLNDTVNTALVGMTTSVDALAATVNNMDTKLDGAVVDIATTAQSLQNHKDEHERHTSRTRFAIKLVCGSGIGVTVIGAMIALIKYML